GGGGTAHAVVGGLEPGRDLPERDRIAGHAEGEQHRGQVDLLLRLAGGLDQLGRRLRRTLPAERERRRAAGLARASREELDDEGIERGGIVEPSESERRRERVAARLLRHDARERVERARVADLAEDQRRVPGEEVVP